ncbi:hypothetical protein TCAL_15479, partial [Tigriopus californicus]
PSVSLDELKANIYDDCQHKDLFDAIKVPPADFKEGIEQYEYYFYSWGWACQGFEPTLINWINSSSSEWDQKLDTEAHFSIGFLTLQNEALSNLVSRSISYANYDEHAITRTPQPTQNLLNLLQVFDLATWIALALALLFFSILIFVFIRVYNSLDVVQCQRAKFADVFIIIFSGFTEPDPVPWFSKQCKG